MQTQIRDIQYFLVIAEKGHLGRAAEALELSQPALTKSVQRLERALGTALLRRGPKGVEPTLAGTALLARAAPLRLALDDVHREVTDLAAGLGGRLRLGLGSDTADELLADACAAMARAAPRVSLHAEVTSFDQLVPALQKGDLDLILSGLPEVPVEGLVHERLYEHEFAVYASERHRLAGRKNLPLEALVREQWTSAPETVNSARALYQAFARHGLPAPRASVVIGASHIRLRVVAATDLLGFFWRQVVRRAEPAVRLVRLDVEELQWRRRVGFTLRAGGYVPPVVTRFREIVKTLVPVERPGAARAGRRGPAADRA